MVYRKNNHSSNDENIFELSAGISTNVQLKSTHLNARVLSKTDSIVNSMGNPITLVFLSTLSSDSLFLSIGIMFSN